MTRNFKYVKLNSMSGLFSRNLFSKFFRNVTVKMNVFFVIAFLSLVLLTNCSNQVYKKNDTFNSFSQTNKTLETDCKENNKCIEETGKEILEKSAQQYQGIKSYKADSLTKNLIVNPSLKISFNSYVKTSKFKLSFNKSDSSEININGENYKELAKSFFSKQIFDWLNQIQLEEANRIYPTQLLEIVSSTENEQIKEKDLNIDTSNKSLISISGKTDFISPISNLIVSDVKLPQILENLDKIELIRIDKCLTKECYVISGIKSDKEANDLYLFWVEKESYLIYRVANIYVVKDKKSIILNEEIHTNILAK